MRFYIVYALMAVFYGVVIGFAVFGGDDAPDCGKYAAEMNMDAGVTVCPNEERKK